MPGVLLAYHDDAAIHRIEAVAALVLGLVVLAVAAGLLLQARRRPTPPPRAGALTLAVASVLLALLHLPLAVFYAGHVPPFGAVTLALPFVALPAAVAIAFAVVAVRRSRALLPVAAFALSGLVVVWIVAGATACVATDACFH